ncbi:MAG: S1C family serine protease [Armatimonadota bacterium]
MEAIASLSNALAGIVDAVGPSVVRVEARHRLPASGIIWAADGVIVTAAHVIEHDEHIRVGLADGQAVPAMLVGRDPTTDVAALRVEASNLRPPVWSEPHAGRAGHLVLSLGRPGRTIRATLGMLSAVADNWQAPSGAQIDRYLQTDTRLAPGFSGGPLADATGNVLGMNTSGLLRRAALTVPVPTLRRVVETLLTHGRMRRGYLGIGAHPVRLPVGLRADSGQQTGLLLVSVEPDSPAERAGLLLGDVILGLGEAKIHHLNDLTGLLTDEWIGQPIPARILRSGTLKDLTIEVGERR